jgi:hypothetical protein
MRAGHIHRKTFGLLSAQIQMDQLVPVAERPRYKPADLNGVPETCLVLKTEKDPSPPVWVGGDPKIDFVFPKTDAGQLAPAHICLARRFSG